MRAAQDCEDITPLAENLVESLRDFGYTLPSAISDLIDNSVAASATDIEIQIEPQTPVPFIAVVDNGDGMDREKLIQAMRMGAIGPGAARDGRDLGRFGLGMKTASLSQGRKLTVITRVKGAEPAIRCLDIDYIQKTCKWQLSKNASPNAVRYARQAEDMKSGTIVLIENLDRASFLHPSVDLLDHLARALDTLRRHVAMVFHRFIEDGVTIRIGQTNVIPWDPFFAARSTKLAEERIRVAPGKTIAITPYILPHHSKLTDDEYDNLAGPNGWNEHQGFYIYRCRRLIVPGTWLNLGLKKSEQLKLARIRVDLPNSVDPEWHLNVMKSHVAVPAYHRDDFARIAGDVRRQAAEVFNVRGDRETPKVSAPERYLWTRQAEGRGARYKLDRAHPLLKALLHCGCTHEDLLETLVSLVESTLPVASILQEPSKVLDGIPQQLDSEELDRLAESVVFVEQFFVRTGKTPVEARHLVLASEPFVRFRTLLLERLSRSSKKKREILP